MGGKLIYIRNQRTGQFLRDTEKWVGAPREAKPFASATEAYDFASGNRIDEAEIVFSKASRVESVLQDIAKSARQGRS